MIADEGRVVPFLGSISHTVRSGDVVLELGTGHGHMAVAACNAGARRVFAIEPNGDALVIASELAAANGCADRITFIHGRSDQVELPERADVLIEDLRGLLPLFGDRIRSLVDVRERLLKPDARLVCLHDTVWAAPCSMPAEFGSYFVRDGVLAGIDGGAVDRRLRNDWCKVRLRPDQLVADRAALFALDLTTVSSPDAHGTASWTIARSERIEGIALWFRGGLAGGFTLDAGPGGAAQVYAQTFFPLTSGIDVVAGDLVQLDFWAKHTGTDYLFGWTTTHTSGSAPAAPPTVLRQSTLGSAVGTLPALMRRRADHRPVPGPAAATVNTLMALADGTRSYAEIAEALVLECPGRFRDRDEALAYAMERIAALEDDDSIWPRRHS